MSFPVNVDHLAGARDTTSDGSLPAFAWPGGYPIYYITQDGLVVCPKCANDPDTSDPVADFDINWEDPALFCEDKGERIESAYAEDDAPPLTEVIAGMPTIPGDDDTR